MSINPIGELFNSFDEIHYFIAGFFLGFLFGFGVCLGVFKNIINIRKNPINSNELKVYEIKSLENKK